MKLLLLFLYCVGSLGLLTKRRFDNAKVFRTIPKNEEEVNFIKHLDRVLELDFWKPYSSNQIIPNNIVDFHANAEDSETIRRLFEQSGINYKILFQSLQEVIENQNKSDEKLKKKLYNDMRYHSWNEIDTWAFNVSIMNPNLVSYTNIGTTHEGRPMLLLKVGSQKAKMDIFLECGVHAREWISPAFCQWFVNQAIKTYGKDKTMTKLLDSVNFHVLPVFNVDGYIWTWTNNRMWRKNRFPNPNSKCIGTDLNRNFNASWNTIDPDKSPCSDGYAGSAAESEKETKAVTSYIRDRISSMKAYISFHSCGQMLFYPYGYTFKEAPNSEQLHKIAESAVKDLSSLYGTNYKYGPIASTIYPVSGSSVDWAYDEGIKYSFGFELRDSHNYCFLLPEYEIKPTCKETMLAVQRIASYILNLDI